jgi:hypothetical protein
VAAAVPFAFLGGTGGAVYGLIATVAPFAYFVWYTASERQATLGKQLCGLKVAHADTGERITLLRSLGRELAKFLSAAVFLIGFAMAAFTPRKQGLHDYLATTVVVRAGPARTLLAVMVSIAGIVIPLILIPLLFGALFATLMMMLMGGVMGAITGGDGMKNMPPLPRIEQPVKRPRPEAAAPRRVYATTRIGLPEANALTASKASPKYFS